MLAPVLSWKALIGPTKPEAPKPAEKAVPLISSAAETSPVAPAEIIIGRKSLGFS